MMGRQRRAELAGMIRNAKLVCLSAAHATTVHAFMCTTICAAVERQCIVEMMMLDLLLQVPMQDILILMQVHMPANIPG